MSEKTIVSQSPGGLLRWFLRFPIILYRLNLGFLLGGRFMLIHHIGRKSGQVRQVVVEVIGHDKNSDTYFVASGWGYKAQWYLNLQAHPDINIQVGRRKLAVHTYALSAEDGATRILDYRQKHPFVAKELSQLMGLDIGQATKDELIKIVCDSLPIVAFEVKNSA